MTRRSRPPPACCAATAVEPAIIAELADLLTAASTPALVVGAGADDPTAWRALQDLAERLDCPVWQEAFGGRAGFPQDHPLFAGHLPAARTGLRKALAGHDMILVVGAPVFRQYHFDDGRLTEPGTRIALISDDPDEINRSPVELAVLAHPAAACTALADHLRPRPRGQSARHCIARPSRLRPAPTGGWNRPRSSSRSPSGSRMTPSWSRRARPAVPTLQALVPAQESLGFLSAAMGGLGFGLPAAIGVRMARPDRPVVAVLGDGSTLYAVQALWSAAHYGIGVLAIVLANGRYAIMDHLAQTASGVDTPLRDAAPWPSFDAVSVSGLAAALGCPSRVVTNHRELIAAFDEILPTLARENRAAGARGRRPVKPHRTTGTKRCADELP